MAQMMMDGILIGEVETKDIMTKSSLPVGGYSVNPYVGCTHACKYCYACFMKRFRWLQPTGGDFSEHPQAPGTASRQRCGYSDLHQVGSCRAGR